MKLFKVLDFYTDLFFEIDGHCYCIYTYDCKVKFHAGAGPHEWGHEAKYL